MEREMQPDSAKTQEVAEPVELVEQSDDIDESVFTDDEIESDGTDPISDDEFEDEDIDIQDEDYTSENNLEVAEPESESQPLERQSAEDNSKFAAARRESEAQLLQLKARQDSFAKQYGYDSFEEMEAAQKARKYMDEGYDEQTAVKLVEHEELKERLQRLENESRIKTEKERLKGKQFFSELESEVDAYLKQNPNLPVELVFNTLRGMRFEELMEKKTTEVKQKTLNNSKSKQHLKPDSKGVNVKNTGVSDEEYKMYAKMVGKPVSKADYAKWRAEN